MVVSTAEDICPPCARRAKSLREQPRWHGQVMEEPPDDERWVRHLLEVTVGQTRVIDRRSGREEGKHDLEADLAADGTAAIEITSEAAAVDRGDPRSLSRGREPDRVAGQPGPEGSRRPGSVADAMATTLAHSLARTASSRADR